MGGSSGCSKLQLDQSCGNNRQKPTTITGKTEDVMALTPLEDKWKSFGWNVSVVDGHDILPICNALLKKIK